MNLRIRFQSGGESHFTEGETEAQESQKMDSAIEIGETTETSIQFS